MNINPVIIKELRGRMRGWRASVIVSIYLLVVSAVMLLFYNGMYNNSFFGANSQIGKNIFLPIIIVQVLLLSIITPISTAASISSERERQTYDVLLTTLLPHRSIILGKLLAAMAYSLLLIIVTLPLEVLSLLLGGLGIEDVLAANLVLLAMTVLYGCFGIYSSARISSTIGATSLAIGFVVFLSVLVPLFAYLGIFASAVNGFSGANDLFNVISAFSPPFAFANLLGSSGLRWFQPWQYFVIFAAIYSALLIWLSVRALRPSDRRLKAPSRRGLG